MPAAPPARPKKSTFRKIFGTPSYDTLMERGDQYEHFAEKIIKKYHFLAKLEKI